MKAVEPYISKNEEKFWNHDIKLAREYDKTFGGAEATDLANRYVNINIYIFFNFYAELIKIVSIGWLVALEVYHQDIDDNHLN